MLQSLYDALFGAQRAAPDPAYAGEAGYRRLQRRMACLIGVLALCVPLVALAVALQPNTCFPDSISHLYYWEGYGDLFVAALVAIATLMFIFRGESVLENVSASLAGLGALGTALLPTKGSGCEAGGFPGRGFGPVAGSDLTPQTPFETWPGVEHFHYGAAALLIVVLGYYCFFVFTRCAPENCDGTGEMQPTKRLRNRVYHACGWVISAVVLGFILQLTVDFPWWEQRNATFWLETAALLAFGIAWALKGRLFNVLKDRPTF